jgi:predicted phage-related endonuclease
MSSEKAIAPEKVPVQQSSVDPDTEYKKSLTAVTDIKKSLNQLKQLKNELENNYNNMIKSVAKNLIKPDSIGK